MEKTWFNRFLNLLIVNNYEKGFAIFSSYSFRISTEILLKELDPR